MRQMKLYAKSSHYRYKSPSIERTKLLNQIFQTDQRNKIWVGDITCFTQKGTLYLVVFVDMYSRKFIGWSMSTRMKDSLVIEDFLQGYKKEHPQTGLIIYTGQGSQYTSSNFQTTLKNYGAVSSVSRKGNPYANVSLESFCKSHCIVKRT
ncbi:hypothetical protein IIU_06856 [Bacillus cereus VD133]|uniref:Integrase catalytic domain-containing protein n=1 Tax=Bacillus cereus VD133 TaxID=1053233 RepID=A0A9W5PJE4_BACCE|nr:IS3 family transposase [Bacillus cereus]EOO24069.1 hypothetical protein IIU_06856 [Bacillus cereus VD133]